MNKNIKNFINYFLGPLLFAWLVYSIYQQISQQPELERSWERINNSLHSTAILYLAAAFVLIPINWGIEALKWKYAVASLHTVSFLQAFKAVLSGVSFSVTMPNRVGEYLGRVIYLPEGLRLKTISVTLVCSFSQMLTTLLAGALGLIVLKDELLTAYPRMVIWYQFLLYGLLSITAILGIIYFNVAGSVGLFRKWIRNKKYHYLVEALSGMNTPLLSKILLFSIIRYGVFALQYILLFHLFGVDVSAAVMFWVMSVVFLALTIVPSIALVEVGVRGEISLRLMGIFSANSLGISLTSITIWFINLILPAIVGSLLMLNIRIFKSEHLRRIKVRSKQTADQP